MLMAVNSQIRRPMGNECRRTRLGLADSGWPEEGRVGLGLHERQGREVLDLARVDSRLEGEVVLVQCLVVWEPGEPQAVA